MDRTDRTNDRTNSKNGTKRINDRTNGKNTIERMNDRMNRTDRTNDRENSKNRTDRTNDRENRTDGTNDRRNSKNRRENRTKGRYDRTKRGRRYSRQFWHFGISVCRNGIYRKCNIYNRMNKIKDGGDKMDSRTKG